MIEKLPFETRQATYEDRTFEIQENASPYDIQVKVNELVDVVNKQEQAIKSLIDGLERFAKSQQEVNTEIEAIITRG